MPKKLFEQIKDEAAAEPLTYEAEKPLIIRYKEYIFSRYHFRYNKVTDVLEFSPISIKVDELESFSGNWEIFRLDEDLNALWLDFMLSPEFGSKEKPGIKVIERILRSHFTPNFDAFIHFLNGSQWDGRDHIGELASTITPQPLHLSSSEVLPNVWPDLFRRWMIAAAACIAGRAPNQVMLLLIGAQGTFKTTWLNRLCPERLTPYRFTGHINPELTDNNTANLLAEKAILNIDDQLENIFNKDFNKIKSIISIDKIDNRKAFRKDSKQRPRRANIVGSVNGDRIFYDSENRRYLTVPIEKINIGAPVNIDQAWLQAWHLLKQGERHWFDGADIRRLNAINNTFAVNTPEEEWLLKLYEPANEAEPGAVPVMTSEILSTIRAASGLNPRQHLLVNAFKKQGWEQTSRRVGHERHPRRVYILRELFIKDDNGRVRTIQGYQQPAEPVF